MTETLFTISVSKTMARRVLAAAAVLTITSQVGAQQAPVQMPAATIVENTTSEDIQKFCSNIADAARDQRYVLQKQELTKLQADVDQRIKSLQDRTAEYQDWLKRRNDFLAKAQAGLVDIFKTMKPDAAAPQLQEMKMEIAAAIIMQLPARQSALFLSEMDPQKAGMISTIISSATDPNTSRARQPAPNTPKAPS